MHWVDELVPFFVRVEWTFEFQFQSSKFFMWHNACVSTISQGWQESRRVAKSAPVPPDERVAAMAMAQVELCL